MATVSSISPPTSNHHTKAQSGQLSITPISAASPPGSATSPSSNVSTPTSTSTSTSTAQIAIKPAATTIQSRAMAAVALASPGPPKCSITSKEWVIPPRPKPGRKPATDTPPTKRKAQNRAAQRAFRERRAARVGELEEQLEEQREEHERAQQELQDQVHSLDGEVKDLRDRCVALESMLEKERSQRRLIENELESFKRRRQDEAPGSFSRKGSLPVPHGRTASSHSIISPHQTQRNSIASSASDHRNSTACSISQIISPPDTDNSSVSDQQQAPADLPGCGNCNSAGPCACVDDIISDASIGCGKCSIGTKCECLEAVLKGPAPNSDSDLKRRPSAVSPHAPDEKRQRLDPYPNEIDFTPMFSRKTTAQVAQPTDDFQPVVQQTTNIPPRDSCGFCSEGTYCMCAEAAASSQTLAPMGHQVQTPPPSENDVGTAIEVTSTGAIKLPGIRTLNRTPIPSARKPGRCGPNGPGTCAQCLADPKSGLFCRSLAANAARTAGSSSKPDGGCCGGKGGAGCCKSQDTKATSSASGLGVSLTCADAYKTLSSHRNFERAADEIGTWLPKLKAIPQDFSTSARAPIEVETASIMSVLKGFDVRFGKNA